MRLHQLRSLLEVADRGLNVSAAARSLFISQSAVSTHLKQLEDELGAALFAHDGKKLTGLTPVGQDALTQARQILNQVAQLKRVRDEHYAQNTGTLTIGVTFTLAHRFLPRLLKQFTAEFPDVSVSVRQGSPREIARLVQIGEADLCISTEVVAAFPDLVMLPCYQWSRGVVVPENHPLLRKGHISVAQIARYRIVTYDATVDTNLSVRQAFHEAGLSPNIAVTAVDAYTIKRYVKLGLGVGIVADIAFDARADRGLRFIDADHIFPRGEFGVAIHRETYLRGFVYRFIELYAPAWTREKIGVILAKGVRSAMSKS